MPSLAMATILALAAGGVRLASAHGHIHQVTAGGKTYPGFTPWTTPGADTVTWSTSTEDEGPVPIGSLQNSDIICHLDAVNAPASVPVSAGETIKIEFIGGQTGFPHPGAQLAYLAPCGGEGCESVDKTSLSFFKFFENGLVQGGQADSPDWVTQRWATTEAHKSATGTWTETVDTYELTIPAELKEGAYVLRYEMIALHMAGEGNAEFYPQCINIVVSGSGTELPEGASPTTFYASSDPGIDIDIWGDLEEYIVPGPVVVSFGSGGGNTDPVDAEDDNNDSEEGVPVEEEKEDAPAPETTFATSTRAAPAPTTSAGGGSPQPTKTKAAGDDDDEDDEEESSCRRKWKDSKRRRNL